MVKEGNNENGIKKQAMKMVSTTEEKQENGFNNWRKAMKMVLTTEEWQENGFNNWRKARKRF